MRTKNAYFTNEQREMRDSLVINYRIRNAKQFCIFGIFRSRIGMLSRNLKLKSLWYAAFYRKHFGLQKYGIN